MFCPKHPNLFADKKCSKCSKWFCYLCTKVINNNTFCFECAEKGCFFSFSEETDLKEPKAHINISNLQYQVSASLAGQGMIVPWKQKPALKKIPCAYHSYKESIKKCSKCNQMVCKDCLRVDDNVDTICYTCWYKMPVSGEELPDDEIDDLQEEVDFDSIKEGLPPELAKLLEEEGPEDIEEHGGKDNKKEISPGDSFKPLKAPGKNLISSERKKRTVKSLKELEKIPIKHEIKNLPDKSPKDAREHSIEYETGNPSVKSAEHSDEISLKDKQKNLQGPSLKDIKENSIYERGLFQDSKKENWFTNLNFAGEEYDPHSSEESSEEVIISTGKDMEVNKKLSDNIEINAGNEVINSTEKVMEVDKKLSDNIEIKTGNIEQINNYFQNILQAIESPGEEKPADKTPEEMKKNQEDILSDITNETFEKILDEEEIDLSEIDEILSSEEGFIEGDFDLSEIDELLENAEKEKIQSGLEDFILSDNLLSKSEENKINEKEEFISKFNSEKATLGEKKEILEHIGKIQDSTLTEYIGNIVLHEAHKELRIKAAEILVERMDEDGLDYLMTGIKSETDSDVRKCIALAYSKLKYKK